MCTVTLFPKGSNGFVLTSNRDEAPLRKALKPDVFRNQQATLWYPKDPEGKGSWIGVSSKCRAICLLNGAFQKHKRSLPYRQSRGIVVTNFLKCDHIEGELHNYDLENIEPFTLIAADWNRDMQWFELVWDGVKRHVRQLPLEPHIWSSSTLYNPAMREERRQWFDNFFKDNDRTLESISKFHRTAGDSNSDYGVIMDRGFVKTTSITQIVKKENDILLRFEDLLEQTKYSNTIELPLVLNE